MNNTEVSIKFLLFRGKWENEGVFGALESEQDIIIFAAGKDYYLNETSFQQIGKEYLKEKKKKIKAFVFTNTSFRNINFLDELCAEINVPIYTSFQSKIILNSTFPKLKNRILVVEEFKNYQLGEIKVSFLECNSYLVGNLAVHYQYRDYSFFFIEDFVFNSFLESDLFVKNNFFTNLKKFLETKEKNNYLLTSCQNLHWNNDNSLFFIKNHLPFPLFETPFFIFYDFDWLRIVELLEIFYQQGKKVIIVNPDFFYLLRKLLTNTNSHLKKVVEANNDTCRKKENNKVYLLTINPQQLNKETLAYFFQNFSFEEKNKFHYVVGLPPVLGGEEKLARLLDYLYEENNKVTNLSKKSKANFNLGISFSDLQILIRVLNPVGTLILNNSYRNREMIHHLPKRLLFLENNHYWDILQNKLLPCSSKKTLISLEEVILGQRKSLEENGLLIVCLVSKWEKEQLVLLKVRIEKIAIFLRKEELEKIEEKIKNSWWESKIAFDIKKKEKDNSQKLVKNLVERRVNSLTKNYVSNNLGKEIEELAVILLLK